LTNLEHNSLLLSSPSPFERQKAATWFAINDQEGDSSFIAAVIQRESVPSIRRLLLRALANRQATRDPLTDGAAVPDGHGNGSVDGRRPELITQDLSSMIWHELSPPIGWLASSLREESEFYEDGAAWRALQSLERRLEGLISLIKLEEPLSLSHIKLSKAVVDAWPSGKAVPEIRWESGADDTEIKTDRGLYNTVLANLFQNALDAAVPGTPIVIRVGVVGERFWIRISNHFNGISFEMKNGRDVVSTKSIQRGRGTGYVFLAAGKLGLEVTIRGQSGIAIASVVGSVN
jgi:signal transduction histidine kinase